MSSLGHLGRAWVLAAHLFFAAVWIGGIIALGLVGLQALAGAPGYGLSWWIDNVMIIPACLGSLATGLVFSLTTRWGFVRHRWVAVKWALTVSMIVVGATVLGPWVTASQTDPTLIPSILALAAVQLVLLLFMLVLSTLKPSLRAGRGTRPSPPSPTP